MFAHPPLPHPVCNMACMLTESPSLFERAAIHVGLDFMAHPFWDKYLEFEDRVEAHDKVFAIHERLTHIPMHQYARYFEKFRALAPVRPVQEISSPDVVAQFRSDVEQSGMYPSPHDVEAEIRTRVDAYYNEVYHRTNTETNKRWPYESKIGRPYFHVQELDEEQLVNWRRYLTFEETDGNFTRTVFLYERCLVTCALYDEFWMRYARWMSGHAGKEEEVRNIYQRACCVYVPIGRPAVRLLYSAFEESQGRVDVAKDIHEAILYAMPGHLETIQSLAHLVRRHGGLEDSIKVFRAHIESQDTNLYTKGALAAEWAKSLWRIKGKPDEARAVFTKNAQYYLDSRAFWINWVEFEIAQPTSAQKEENQYKRIKAVIEDVRKRATLPPQTAKDIIHYYMEYLLMRGGKEASKEYIELDRQVNGPFVVQDDNKAKLADDGNKATTERRMALENGHPGLEVDEAQIRKGHNIYNKYYQQQGELPV